MWIRVENTSRHVGPNFYVAMPADYQKTFLVENHRPSVLHACICRTLLHYYAAPLPSVQTEPLPGKQWDRQGIRRQTMPEEMALQQDHLQDLADRVTEFLSTGAAAGLPAVHSINSSTIAAAITTQDCDMLLQLMVALVVAGEAAWLWQDRQCRKALLELRQQQQQLEAAAGDVIWPLLQAWVVAMQGQLTAGASTADPVADGDGDGVAAVRQQQQQAPNVLPDTLPDKSSWLQVLTVLWQQQQQQQQQADMSVTQQEGQQDLQHPSGAENIAITSALTSDMCKSCPAGDDPLTAGLPVVRAEGRSPGHVCLELLHLLGCSLTLLQSTDLQTDVALHDLALPPPLHLVLLMRIARRTQHLWLPLLENRPQQQQQGQQQQQQQGQELLPGTLSLANTQHIPQAAAIAPDAGLSQSMEGVGDDAKQKAAAAAAAAVADDSSGATSTGGSDSSSTSSHSHIEEAGNGSCPEPVRPAVSWPAELLSTSQLWPADEDESEAAAITREERTLRCWINSLLHGRCSSSSGSSSSSSMLAGGGSSAAVLQQTGNSSSSMAPPPEASAAASNPAGPAIPPDGSLPGSAAAAVCSPKVSLTGSRQRANSSSGSSSSCNEAAAWSSSRSISSLFGAEVRSGVLLLELLDLLQPGCVDWKRANKPPFKSVGLAAELQAQENCQLALHIAQVGSNVSVCTRGYSYSIVCVWVSLHLLQLMLSLFLALHESAGVLLQ
jgi:hypothetical protein